MGRLILGTDDNDTLVAGSGDTLQALAGNNTFSISTSYSFTGNVFRGGDGDDSYMIRYGGLGRLQAGSRIEDSGGQDTLTIENRWSPGTSIDLNLDGFLSGVVGVARQDQNLLVDLSRDGEFSPEDDLVVVDFFNAAGTGAGTGFIETVNDLRGQQIINQVPVLGSDTVTDGPNIITGTDGDDTLFGTNNNDSILGLGGNDRLVSTGKGNDTLLGGLGNDTLVGGLGDDFLRGGPGNDSLVAGAGNNRLFGDGGNDTLVGNSLGENTLRGGAGNDSIVGYQNDLVLGDSGNNVLIAGSSNVTLEGGSGNDTLRISSQYRFTGNVLRGGDADNTYIIPLAFYGQAGSRIEDSGGQDTLTIVNNLSPGTSIDLNLDGFLPGVVGVARQDQNLLVDLSRDGEFSPEDDLVVVDFFNAAGTGAGTGFIETVNDLRGQQIINQVPVLGSDTVTDGPNIITGTDGDDTLFGTNNNDSILGLGGNDSLVSTGKGNDTLLGGLGNDTLIGGLGDDFLSGGPGNDSLVAGAGNNRLFGDGGNDTLVGNSLGENTLRGGAGNDSIVGYQNDLVLGDSGNNVLIARSSNVTLEGGSGNDTLSISAYSFTGNVFRGGDGDDSYMIRYGGMGRLQAGSRIEDSGGQDTLTIVNNLSPGTPIDLNLDGFLSGVVGVARQDQNLLVDLNQDGEFSPEDDLVVVDFFNAAGTGAGTGFIETVNDLRGQQIINQVPVLGSDTVTDGSDSIIIGTDDNDRLVGTGKGNDTLLGGLGNDTLIVRRGNNFLDGGPGNDRLVGGVGHDTLIGGAGRDILIGGKGNDFLDGGPGNDRLNGGPGNDTLNGGPGRDILTGGPGADVFVFGFGESRVAAPDRITDFEIGTDKIDLLNLHGGDIGVPENFTRARNNNAPTLRRLVNQVFRNADGGQPGQQELEPNSAVLVRATNADIRGTYLVINDNVPGFQPQNDLVINITGYTGDLPGFGEIPLEDFFVI
ncbi:calcium-binding protein [Arthrospira platensis NCB002]|uniref:calcium-binding protein n=2 Tax=Limnospira platensis TaxID=118562 RepID=UPI0011D28ABB|nr:calcium-binding protein [Arthrospira platensis NCB002]BDT16413.1 hypothetical protein N39L_61360 [Arthrospira platensis NIES-39]